MSHSEKLFRDAISMKCYVMSCYVIHLNDDSFKGVHLEGITWRGTKK